jgi:SAM-dependent methyltransferase
MQKDYTATHTGWTDTWSRMRNRLGDISLAAKDEKFRLMKPWLDRLPHRGRILDGGCGLGHWTLFLRSLGFASEGIDISEPTIELLKQQNPRIPFSVGDIRNTGYPDDAFDGYFSWGTFEHFEEGMEQPIREAWRILKPGGLLFLTVPYQNLRHILYGAPMLHVPAHFYQWRFTKHELISELAIRNLRTLAIIPTSKDQGALRFVTNTMHLAKNSIASRAAVKALKTLLPASFIAHMLFVVAQKPNT